MKKILAAAILLALIARPSVADDLRKLSLDDASVLGLKVEADAKVKAEGKASIKITTQWPAVICLGEVTGLDIEEAKLIYKAKVKSELDGSAFLELWVHIKDGQFFSRGMDDAISGKHDWKPIQTPFLFQKGQKPDKGTLNLVINGKGTVWIDDVVLSKEPLN